MEHFEPGLHDLSAERYGAAEGVSCTMLNILAEKTPLHLKTWMDGEAQTPETEALHFGILAHYAILEGEKYKERFHQRPEGMKGTTKEGKQWALDHADKPIVTFEEGQALKGMVASVQGHPFARRLMRGGQPERSLFVVDNHGTIRKSRLDIFTDGNVLPDIKTTRSAGTETFERQILNCRYHVRAAYYLDNCRLLNLDKEHFMFIAVEKVPPYAVRCLKLDGDCITWGRKLYQAELQTWRNCVANNDWPGYEEGYAEISLPQWEMNRIYELI